MLWDHPLCQGCLRQRSYTRIVHLLACIQEGLAALDPATFLMIDAPSGYGYRRLSLSTFCQDFPPEDDEDDLGVTIPWPPGEVQTVARIFHLAGVEGMPLATIAQMCRVSKVQVREILANPLYTRMGVLDDDPQTGALRRLTIISPTLFALCQQQAHVAAWGVPALIRQAGQAHREPGTAGRRPITKGPTR